MTSDYYWCTITIAHTYIPIAIKSLSKSLPSDVCTVACTIYTYPIWTPLPCTDTVTEIVLLSLEDNWTVHDFLKESFIEEQSTSSKLALAGNGGCEIDKLCNTKLVNYIAIYINNETISMKSHLYIINYHGHLHTQISEVCNMLFIFVHDILHTVWYENFT